MSDKKLPPGTGSLIVGALLFISVGIIMILNPVAFTMTGGTGRYGQSSVTSVFSGDESQAFGVIFILLGLLIGYFAYKHSRSSR